MARSPTELKPETLIKRVMSGTKEYRTNQYLESFGKLSSTQLHCDSVSRTEMIKLWNSLQTAPGRVRYFTFSLVDHNHCVQQRIKENYNSIKFAWILHDKDTSAERKHFHYLLMFPNPVSFSSVANTLEIPVTMIQKVFSKRGILDYLTHENDPNKFHYSLSEIESNFDIEEEKKITSDRDVMQLFDDYCLVRMGDLTPRDFIEKYNTDFTTMSLPSILQSFGRLYDGFNTGASLSSRAQCIVSNPLNKYSFYDTKSSKTPLQTVFPELSESSIDWLESGQKVAFDVPKKPISKSKKSYRKPNPRSDLS